MGLFSFIKNAGSKLFGKKEAPKAAEETYVPVELTNDQKADELIAAIRNHGIPIDSLYVAVEDDLATVAGECQTQADRERIILICGNVEGIGQVEDKISIAVEEPEAQFHTVVRGDSLSKIAKAYYGNAMKYPVIFEANKPMLKDPNLIYPGQVLRIPPIA